MQVREAAAQDVQDIPDGRPGWRGHNPDMPGQQRELAFAVNLEQPLARQLLLERFKGGLQRAFPALLHAPHHDLVAPVALIDRKGAMGTDAESVAGHEGQAPHIAPPDDATDLRAFVLDGEIAVAGGWLADSGQLPLHGHTSKASLDQAPDLPGQFRDGEYPGLAICVGTTHFAWSRNSRTRVILRARPVASSTSIRAPSSATLCSAISNFDGMPVMNFIITEA